jgi:hypothetical protein
MATEGDDEFRRWSLLMSAFHAEKVEEAQAKIIRVAIFIGVILFAAWMYNEDAWQAKLDRALSDCLTPMSDGTCAKRDPSSGLPARMHPAKPQAGEPGTGQ